MNTLNNKPCTRHTSAFVAQQKQDKAPAASGPASTEEPIVSLDRSPYLTKSMNMYEEGFRRPNKVPFDFQESESDPGNKDGPAKGVRCCRPFHPPSLDILDRRYSEKIARRENAGKVCVEDVHSKS
jgi:hypothetical protein